MNLRRFAAQFGDYAGFGPGIVISLVVSLATSGLVSRLMGISRAHGWALVMALGVILSATITPSREAIQFGAQGSGTCDFTSLGVGLSDLRHLDESSLNVLLFIPFGIAIGLCPDSSAKRLMLAFALVFPVTIELVQLLAVSLGRECQGSDIVDNLLGLLIGLGAGSVTSRVWRWLSAASGSKADGPSD
jgi:hypothetical protein